MFVVGPDTSRTHQSRHRHEIVSDIIGLRTNERMNELMDGFNFLFTLCCRDE